MLQFNNCETSIIIENIIFGTKVINLKVKFFKRYIYNVKINSVFNFKEIKNYRLYR